MTYQYKAGLGNVGSYQVSGKPYATASVDSRTGTAGVQRIQFPYVTSWVAVTNLDSNDTAMRVGFSEAGVLGTENNYWFDLPAQTETHAPFILEVKVTDLFLSGSNNCSVVAGLTGIPATEITNNWTGSEGVG